MDGNAAKTIKGGSYALWVRRNKGTGLQTGKKRSIYYPAGDYLYFGRAQKGLLKRLERHARVDKRLFWHIDYLLDDSGSRLLNSFILSADPEDECRAAAAVLNRRRCEAVAGFGNSDCKKGCLSHLVYFPRKLSQKELEELLKTCL